MSIFRKMTVKKRLVLGFLLCVSLTAIAVLTAIWALQEIGDSFKTTASSVGSVLTTQQQTNTRISRLRKVILSIRNFDSAEELQKNKSSMISELDKASNIDTAELITIIKGKFLPAKKQALESAKVLVKTSKDQKAAIKGLDEVKTEKQKLNENMSKKRAELEKIMSDLNKIILEISDTVDFESTLKIEDLLGQMKKSAMEGADEKIINKKLEAVQEGIEKSSGVVKRALEVRSDSNKVMALVSNIMLLDVDKQNGSESKDIEAKVEYALEALTTCIDGIVAKLSEMPDSEELKKAKEILTGALPTIKAIQQLKLAALPIAEKEKTSNTVLFKANSQMVAKQKEMVAKQKEMESVASDVFEKLATIETDLQQNAKTMKDGADTAVGKNQSDINWWAFTLGTIGFIAVALALITGWVTARGIVKPIVAARNLAKKISKGDLSIRLNMNSKDEIGELANALDATVQSLQKKAQLAGVIADGDLSSDVDITSEKDTLGKALQHMVNRLNEIIGSINNAASNMNEGSILVAGASQSLSQGATQQAASLEEISSNMSQLQSQTQTNAENASKANDLVHDIMKSADHGNEQMEAMVSSIGDMNTASHEISQIIKVIDGIAFQTNLLALNAAVEAARAGQHGKGFAVVADEVRNLASRSAKAARETADLIENSVKKAEEGTKIASRTAEALKDIFDGVSQVSELVDLITTASNEQADGISQVNSGLEQIDQVTQQNTANAEKTAMAADGLSEQSGGLKQMFGLFTLKLDDGSRALSGGGVNSGRQSIPNRPVQALNPYKEAGDTLLVWDDSLSVKIPQIDVQHKRLVEFVNQLYAAMLNGHGNDKVEPILMELVQYTVTHFGTEEKLFEKYNYPAKEEHIQLHKKLVERVSEFVDKFKSGKASISVQLMEFLKGWLINHIKGTDMKYKDFFISKGVK